MADGVSRSVLVAALAALVLPVGGAAQEWRTITSSRQDDGIDEARVEVKYGAGRFSLGAAEPGLLYRMRLRYDEDAFEPRTDWDGRRLALGVESRGHDLRIGKGRSGGEMELALGSGIPLDLSIDFGAVQAGLDLGGLSLTDLQVTTGASESTLDVSELNPVRMRRATFEVGAADFTARRLGNLNAETIEVSAGVGGLTLWLTGDWQADARLTIDLGLGALDLRVPEGLGIRLDKRSFLTSLETQGLVKRGDSYYSENWDGAAHKVVIDLDAAFGSVELSWVR